tara:strand:- start:415 stop:660 length:246 start_codon:yes stop_codon:yes gene_type:complete
MTNARTQHEHKEFIDKIINKVNAHSRLVSLRTMPSNYRTGNWHGDLRKEALVLMEDIENSLYRRLDEVGDSEGRVGTHENP